MRRPAAAAAALPAALAVDLCVLGVLIRGLHTPRVPAIIVSFMVTIAAWALLSAAAGALLSRRASRGPDGTR